MNSFRGYRGLAWILPALALYFVVLSRLWFDAPVWDDYDATLGSLTRMVDAGSTRDWWREVFRQHNEHRIAVTRIGAWSAWAIFGHVDHRVLVFLGNAGLVGVLVLAWLEFRDEVGAPIVAAAAFLMFQWSYYEASLETMIAVSNLGVLFFAFACLFFALREGPWSAAACVAFGILAAGSQANGLFALPIAAAGCALARRPLRAAIFAVIAAALWLAYFQDYVRPGHHPSPLAALSMPVATAQLFMLNVGSLVPGLWLPATLGVAIMAALAWLTYRGLWKSHPTVALWVIFILGSLAAATLGRVGFGVFHAARYAVNSTCLAVLVLLAGAALYRPLAPARAGWTAFWAIALSLLASVLSWNAARDFSYMGKLLVKAVPATPETRTERYFGDVFLARDLAETFLKQAEARRTYVPREVTVHGYAARHEEGVPAKARRGGHVDEIRIVGNHVIVRGWTDLPGNEPGRTLVLAVRPEKPESVEATVTSRSDVARVHRNPALLFSGFQLDVRFPTVEQALRAAGSLCVFAVPAQGPPAVLHRPLVNCESAP